MKRIILLLLIVAMALLAGCQYESYAIDAFNCEADYNCLHEQVSEGNAAMVIITEEVPSLSVIEKSQVIIKPVGEQYLVTMGIVSLEEVREKRTLSKSISGAIAQTCPQIKNYLKEFKAKSATCTVNSSTEAVALAMTGLSEQAIATYHCTGDLIDFITDICSASETPDAPEFTFPPGVKKPAVYLYPEEEMLVEVLVEADGFITESYPAYDDGWSVTAKPDGIIDGEHDYLFYEAQLLELSLPDKGWVVAYEDLASWFDAYLPALGLNEKESRQFEEYWLAELRPSAFYDIRLLERSFLDEHMGLVISPEPETVIRLDFYFRPLDGMIDLQDPVVVTPERVGFTVVEWGGLLDG